jgi:predicted restriction endonuclease
MPEFSSENSPSGGGGTVTTLGLLQLKNAALIWLGHDSDGLPDAYKDWEPAADWQERRNALLRENTETINRPGASEFRNFVLDTYSNTCAVSKFISVQTIEIAHIVPYYGVDSDHIENAVPLRADLHKLFDKGLLLIFFSESEKKYRVKIHDFVMNDYKILNGVELNLPQDRNFAPSRLALIEHEKLFKNLWQII